MGLNVGIGSFGVMAGGIITVTCWFKIKSEGRETREAQASARTIAGQALNDRLHLTEAAIGTFKSREALTGVRKYRQSVRV